MRDARRAVHEQRPAHLRVAGLDKDVARRLVASAGVKVPWGVMLAGGSIPVSVPYPAIVKPAWEGSSKGIRGKCVAYSAAELAVALAGRQNTYRQPLLVEEFIAGDELTVGVVGNASPRILGFMRVIPNRTDEPFVYSLEVKRDYINQVKYECPARLAPELLAAIEEATLTAYCTLGCRDVARIDFRLRDGVTYFIEANPLPGLNP